MSHINNDRSTYTPCKIIQEIAGRIAVPTESADFPEAILRYYNYRWAEKIGLENLSSPEKENHFCKLNPLPDNLEQPLALAYHGHQFGHYNPDIGDGRGFLFAQLKDHKGRVLDLGTKGSGQTLYSRHGDGRLTLKGGVREVLATEMLEALGVNTSKTFSLFETGEKLYRGDEPSPTRSSVMVRLSHSHIRFGTFQRLAYQGDKEGIAELVDYCVRHYHPAAQNKRFEEQVRRFLEEVVTATADMIASWMAAGFVHGVMNTDNMVITGESFDYGPYRFLPHADANFVAAYFDEAGRYRYGRQPAAGLWNLAQLAMCLVCICPEETLEAELAKFEAIYQASLRRHILRRIGVVARTEEEDAALVQSLMTWLEASGARFEQFFFDWYGGELSSERQKKGPQAQLYADTAFSQISENIRQRDPVSGINIHSAYFERERPVTLIIEDIENLWKSISQEDDWTPFYAYIEDINLKREALNTVL